MDGNQQIFSLCKQFFWMFLKWRNRPQKPSQKAPYAECLGSWLSVSCGRLVANLSGLGKYLAYFYMRW